MTEAAPARKLFGTDGIRGRAGVYPLDPETILRLGQAAAEVFATQQHTKTGLRLDEPHQSHENGSPENQPHNPHVTWQGLADDSTGAIREIGKSEDWPTVIIGKDTRQSCDMLEAAIAAGLNSRGVDVRLAGVIPTPGIAYLTRELNANFGIVISASHNPFYDNGIKFFGPDGYKLPDNFEAAIEERLLSDEPFENSGKIGRTAPMENAVDRYIHFVCEGAEENLGEGLTIALDTANGASFETSEAILKNLGAEVIAFHNRPSGLNINEDCGCTHASVIEKLVRETVADIGISHDGDADRVLLCDENGSVLDGDELMAIAAIDLIAQDRLNDKTMVATVMSNAGLIEAVVKAGGKVIRAGVGDRYVMEEMRKANLNFGGEQSGHLIFRDLNTTGDGIVAAVQFLRIVKRTGKPLSELRKQMSKFPQTQRNVRVTEKLPIAELEEASRLIAETESKLGAAGRTLIRYSGTEPLLRLLIEGRDAAYIEERADLIAAAIAEQIGE